MEIERVKNILQRLQDLYYAKHQKSAIDIDLMLDYTRVMYADLLELRKKINDPITTETVTVQNNVPNKAASENQMQQKQEDPAVEADPEPQAAETTIRENQEEIPAEAPAAAPLPTQNSAVDIVVNVSDKESVVHHFPEQESLKILESERSGISFEPPHAMPKPVVIEEELVEEEPSVPAIAEDVPVAPPLEIPLPETAVKPVVPKTIISPQLFQSVKVHSDIRGSIGINDKYLFLNELFNNHKTNYEETLDMMNQMSTYKEALDWIQTKVVTAQKWDDQDETTKSFYAILGKHFANT